MGSDGAAWVSLRTPSTRTPGPDDRAGVNPAPKARGCQMSDSLYVKANGEMPCWDDAGEQVVLRTLTEEELRAGDGQSLLNFDALVRVRRSFLDPEGEYPHPEVCARCAVNGHGEVTSLVRDSIRVLHIEPCYLCQLACPLCYTPKQRLELKGRPYYMSLSFYEAFLARLHREGVRAIEVVHFEGRGDPLLNRDLGDMVRLTKRLYPAAFTQATTHGNYPFKPWMLDSGLDMLRLSVDGAFDDSYATYRVNGDLQKVLRLMRDIRDARSEIPSSLRVQWKYILFEWNDSDDEIAEADRLATELGVELSFCLTHTPGRSQRFTSVPELCSALPSLAPHAAATMTFPLKGLPAVGRRRLVARTYVRLRHEARLGVSRLRAVPSRARS